MAKPRATGADARLIGITETTYGTAPTDGYFVLPFKSTDLDKETPIGDDPLLGQGRAAQGAYYDRSSVAGGLEIPLDIRSAGFWLHGLMGAPTSTSEAPGYKHLFTGAAPRRRRPWRSGIRSWRRRLIGAISGSTSTTSRSPCRRVAWRPLGSTP